jgi:NADH-quinone oxidoreductase subunit G
VPGALTAVASLARASGAKLAWVPRRAGDRGAVETGCLPNLLHGALVVGGVDPDDTADPRAFRAALEAASFVVSLEQRETDVTRVADVVFPVAPVTDKPGTFVTWEGRPREFPAVFVDPNSLPDARVLAGIAEELHALGRGRPLGFRTSAEAHDRMVEMGPWDGERANLPDRPAVSAVAAGPGTDAGQVALATWKLMLDNGSMQDGEKYLRATARTPVCRLSPATAAAVGAMVTLEGDRGSVTLPVQVVDDLADDVAWVPANSTGNGVLADLASPGSGVTVKGGSR